MADKITRLGEGTKPLFTQRHYEAIAFTLKDQVDYWQASGAVEGDLPMSILGGTVGRLMELFLKDNSRFNGGKFLTACGIGGSSEPLHHNT